MEARCYYKIGLPIFIAQLSQTGMTFADTAMTGQYNAEDMAAVVEEFRLPFIEIAG